MASMVPRHLCALGCAVFAALFGVILAATSNADSESSGNIKFPPPSAHLPVAPPDGAIVLFDGSPNHLFLSMHGKAIDWPIEQGALISTDRNENQNHIVSRLHFRDADIHVEFMLPPETPTGPGNSGVYIHGNYELQIFNTSPTQELTDQEIGAVYGFAKPLTYAGRPPGEWQSYDIRYRAPRRDASGQISEEGCITAYLNGKLVQNGTRFGEPRSVYHPFRYHTTPYLQKIYRRQKTTHTGPLFLQDHDAPVRFRNIWVRPLDDRAFMYEPAP